MPPNSITLDFQKMPTVTVDGKTHKFQADKATTGFHEITQGGVTYSLVKDAASDRFKMTIKGEPAALEKYNFGVGKGRVTDAKFGGGDLMDRFFKGFVSVGDQKAAVPDYFQNFSIGGAQLADRTAFLQSGAWGMDQSSAEKELNRLEEEAEAAAKKAKEAEDAKKNSGTQEAGDQKPVVKTNAQVVNRPEDQKPEHETTTSEQIPSLSDDVAIQVESKKSEQKNPLSPKIKKYQDQFLAAVATFTEDYTIKTFDEAKRKFEFLEQKKQEIVLKYFEENVTEYELG